MIIWQAIVVTKTQVLLVAITVSSGVKDNTHIGRYFIGQIATVVCFNLEKGEALIYNLNKKMHFQEHDMLKIESQKPTQSGNEQINCHENYLYQCLLLQ